MLVPRRKINRGVAGRAALLHAIAHIELNALDLAWDLIGRFGSSDLPRSFFDDWVKVADEEALHFTLVVDRMATLGLRYGDLEAHDGLWEAALDTQEDLLARLAVVPLVLEARGLDVTPTMIAKLRAADDPDSAAVLDRIYRDEIGHVAAGVRWFHFVARQRGLDATAIWPVLVAGHFKGQVKPPFNLAARDQAGMGASFMTGAA
jgi:uncharacterized ferritin-like protein (DUF455 family)